MVNTLSAAASSSVFGMVLWIVVLIGMFYFMLIRPQQKDTKQKNAMLANLALGDTILTSSGFYGVIIDIEEDTVIVEFGSNRNCRIPMQKSAIQAVEKPEDATEDAWENDKKK